MTPPSNAAQAPLRVLVVDADDRIRESLARLLPIGGRCLVVATAGQPETALELAGSMGPDVVVVDSRLLEIGADRTFIERLRVVAPDVRIVVLNWSDSAESQVGLPGADVYIRKTFRAHELIDAVVSAAHKTVA
jgi:two-component system, OmpR family, response regulator